MLDTEDVESSVVIRSVRRKVSAVNIVLDDSESFISSDVEHLFLSSYYNEDKKNQADDTTLCAETERSNTSDELSNGSDYKELMEKIMHDSNNI